jgi:mannose-6-phosphate isomerase-like protein (cupin superfamily)
MIHQAPDRQVGHKGWFVGPWNSAVPIPVGFANAGVNEPHHHAHMFELYLVASGTSTAVVNHQTHSAPGGRPMLVVEPGESHTFTQSSEDYFHFVIQTPFMPGDKMND